MMTRNYPSKIIKQVIDGTKSNVQFLCDTREESLKLYNTIYQFLKRKNKLEQFSMHRFRNQNGTYCLLFTRR